MQQIGLFLLIFSAIAIGWWMGHYRRDEDEEEDGGQSSNYFQGLNYLLNDQPDAAIDAFVESLEVNSDTLETHLAVGNLLRKKGEVDRAIRVHQNLLARPGLPERHRNQVQLELARDYISLGVLDRAERILVQLTEDSDELNPEVLKHLLEIYQDEKEWDQAVDIAQRLLPRKNWLRASASPEQVLSALAHFFCELAEQSWRDKDYHQARKHLRKALSQHKRCVRASLMLAELELETGQPAKALKAAKEIPEQDARFVAECLPLLETVFQQASNRQEWHDFLQAVYERCPTARVLEALVATKRDIEGEQAATHYLTEQLQKRPSLRGVESMLSYCEAFNESPPQDVLVLLREIVDGLLSGKPTYLCKHCGFSGREMHWSCPTCKQWGTIAPIRGVEGD